MGTHRATGLRALAGVDHSDPTGEVLSIGSRGDDVKTLQSTLSGLGFDPGPSDGVFGPMTLSAVLSYQRYEKLWVDGLVGPKTRASLGMG